MQYLIYKNQVVATLVQPTNFKQVFASRHWTWDGVAGGNVLVKRLNCRVSSSRKWAAKAGPDTAYPLPGGVSWEFLVVPQ